MPHDSQTLVSEDLTPVFSTAVEQLDAAVQALYDKHLAGEEGQSEVSVLRALLEQFPEGENKHLRQEAEAYIAIAHTVPLKHNLALAMLTGAYQTDPTTFLVSLEEYRISVDKMREEKNLIQNNSFFRNILARRDYILQKASQIQETLSYQDYKQAPIETSAIANRPMRERLTGAVAALKSQIDKGRHGTAEIATLKALLQEVPEGMQHTDQQLLLKAEAYITLVPLALLIYEVTQMKNNGIFSIDPGVFIAAIKLFQEKVAELTRDTTEIANNNLFFKQMLKHAQELAENAVETPVVYRAQAALEALRIPEAPQRALSGQAEMQATNTLQQPSGPLLASAVTEAPAPALPQPSFIKKYAVPLLIATAVLITAAAVVTACLMCPPLLAAVGGLLVFGIALNALIPSTALLITALSVAASLVVAGITAALGYGIQAAVAKADRPAGTEGLFGRTARPAPQTDLDQAVPSIS